MPLPSSMAASGIGTRGGGEALVDVREIFDDPAPAVAPSGRQGDTRRGALDAGRISLTEGGWRSSSLRCRS